MSVIQQKVEDVAGMETWRMDNQFFSLFYLFVNYNFYNIFVLELLDFLCFSRSSLSLKYSKSLSVVSSVSGIFDSIFGVESSV